MPPRVGVDSDVEPPFVATEKTLCGPKEVSFERVHSGPGMPFRTGPVGTPAVFGTSPLPGSTLPQNMPPWWSAESKSLLDSTTITPFSSRYRRTEASKGE